MDSSLFSPGTARGAAESGRTASAPGTTRCDVAPLPVREELTLPADTVVVCAGQEPRDELARELAGDPRPVHVIGGADVAAELDAKRAIRQAVELAASLP